MDKRQKHGQKPIDNVDNCFLGVFGYSAKVYRVEHTCRQSDRALDRYDARHFDQNSCFEPALDDEEFHSMRFAELEHARVSEAQVFGMSGEDRRMYIESIGCDAPNSTIQLSEPNDPEPNKLKLPVHVPDSMTTPRTLRQFEIIEHTARFIANQPPDRASCMELTIQGKQGTSADFEFLNQTSALYPFYTHVVWLMRTNLYSYTASSSDSEHEAHGGSEPLAAPLDEKAKRRLRAVEFLRLKRKKI